MKCWEKSPGEWASCSASCGELKQFGGEWTCEELGGARGAHNVAPISSKESLGYQSLFCFMVVTDGGVVPPGVKVGYEARIVQAMRKARASIFGCDGSAIYDGAQASK